MFHINLTDAFEDNLIDLASKYDQFTEKEAIEFGKQIYKEIGGEEDDYNPEYAIMVFDDMVRRGEGLIKQLVGKVYIWK